MDTERVRDVEAAQQLSTVQVQWQNQSDVPMLAEPCQGAAN